MVRKHGGVRFKKKFLKFHNGLQQEKKKKLTWATWGYYLDKSAWVGTGLWDSEEPNPTQQSGSFVSLLIPVLHQYQSLISLRKE